MNLEFKPRFDGAERLPVPEWVRAKLKDNDLLRCETVGGEWCRWFINDEEVTHV